jgi:transketolase
MRGIFLDALYEEMGRDESLFFLTADMGINLVEKFEDRFPDRFLNVGIAEQNMIGIAAGLAESGMKPYVYTISNFLVHRALEQIRNDLVLHNLPVTLIGTSTGYDNGPLGPTHHMLEDWGILAAFPGVRIFAPFSELSAKEIFRETLNSDGVKYVRIAKGDGLEKSSLQNIEIHGKHLVLSYGSAVAYALAFANESGANFLAMSELGLQSKKFFDQFCRKFEKITVVEDHFSHIGMYSYLCQWVVENHIECEVENLSPKEYSLKVGSELSDFMGSSYR